MLDIEVDLRRPSRRKWLEKINNSTGADCNWQISYIPSK